MNIITVKELENSYLVNDSISVPKDSKNKDYNKVQSWLAISGNNLTDRADELLIEAKQKKCAEIITKRNTKILEDSIRYGEANTAESLVEAMTDIEDINNFDVESNFSE